MYGGPLGSLPSASGLKKSLNVKKTVSFATVCSLSLDLHTAIYHMNKLKSLDRTLINHRWLRPSFNVHVHFETLSKEQKPKEQKL